MRLVSRQLALFCFTLLSTFSIANQSVQARAPDTFEEMHAVPTVIDSPQWYAFEFKLGPYSPGGENRAFKDTFGNDRGWLVGVEFDLTIWHIPYVGTINAGAGFAWANYDAKAFVAGAGSTRAGENTEFTIYPLSALAVLRIDALARNFGVPILFAAKIGYDFVPWSAETGGRSDANGLNKGLRYGGQVGLELDFFEPDAARTLDQEYGINHTSLFFEFFESKTKGTGDRSFALGFGAVF